MTSEMGAKENHLPDYGDRIVCVYWIMVVIKNNCICSIWNQTRKRLFGSQIALSDVFISS